MSAGSSYASSIQSRTGIIAGYAQKMTGTRPDIQIILDNHEQGKVYSTFDALSGHVEIVAPQNARFDEVQITLEGTVKTQLETMSPSAATGRTTALHRFLKLVMPVRESQYPQPRVAEAGRRYTFPFNFVVPEQLLPTACAHECENDHVGLAHLQLPPSMGDREVSGQDDLSPEMAKVLYDIKVKILRKETDAKAVTLVESSRKLNIIPASAEAPPNLDEDDFVLEKTKSLKKGMFSGKLGRITISTSQTKAFLLPPSDSKAAPAAVMAKINLRFDPHEPTSQPPRLGGLTTKMKSSTFYAAKPSRTFPTRTAMALNFESMRAVYHTTLPLSSRCVEAVSWTKHEAQPPNARRNSIVSTSSSDYSDTSLVHEKKENGVYYTAEILVPVNLPSTKTWLPTFHSCIVSRAYALDFALTIHTPGTGVPASSVSLRAPVQIAASANRSGPAVLTAAEAAAELADADEYFRPRVIEAPREELVQNSVLGSSSRELPPSYEDSPDVRREVDPSRC